MLASDERGPSEDSESDVSSLIRVMESQQSSLHMKDEQISRLLDMLQGVQPAKKKDA